MTRPKTLTTQQTILVAVFCGGGAFYNGSWIAERNGEGQLSFLSVTRRRNESAAQAAARCIKEQMWADSPLDEHSFFLAGHEPRTNTKIFKSHFHIPLQFVDMVKFAISSNRGATGFTPPGMTVHSRRALSRAPALANHMRGITKAGQLHA